SILCAGLPANQNPAPFRLHRTTDPDLQLAFVRDGRIRLDDDAAGRHDRSIHDEPECSLLAVPAQQHDGTAEVPVRELRHGEKQRRGQGRHGHDDNARATFRKSSMKRFVSVRLVSSSGARSNDEGCTVAVTIGASGDSTNSPRCAVTLKAGPSSAWAAVAPRHTIARGLTR